MKPLAWLAFLIGGLQRQGRGCRHRFYGCLTFIVLLMLLLCGLFFILTWSVGAAAQPLAVYLLIDNSNSMFEKAGIGSDPHLLRIDAARLFITYLGVDQSNTVHAASVIFFGSDAETIVPLTPLSSDEQRAQIFSHIARPPHQGWTEQAAALALAHGHIESEAGSYQPALVLLTDGKPEWANMPTAAEKATYAARLRAEGQALAALRVPIFIILLANEATDADPEINQLWQPLWQEMSAATPPGRFFIAREAADLTGIYHDIVVALTGGQTAGAVAQKLAEAAELRQVVAVEPNLARLTFVISKSSPGVQVTILKPGGAPLTTGERVRHAGGEREEVWAVELPPAGTWTVLASGAGRVTVWKDVQHAPTRPAPTPSATLATSQVTAAPPTAIATITAPPAPPTSTPAPAVAAVVPPAPTVAGPAPHIKEERAAPWWLLWLFVPLAAAATGLWQRRRRQPLVAGTLRLGGGATTVAGQHLIDLEALQQPQVTIGAAPADVVLDQTTGRLTIRPGERVGDVHEMLVSGTERVYLDGRPLAIPTPLTDDAVIDLEPYRLRYENLRIRSAIHSESWRARQGESS